MWLGHDAQPSHYLEVCAPLGSSLFLLRRLCLLGLQNLYLRWLGDFDDRLLFVALKLSGDAHTLIDHAVEVWKVRLNGRHKSSGEARRLCLAEVNEAHSVLGTFASGNDVALYGHLFAKIGLKGFSVGRIDDWQFEDKTMQMPVDTGFVNTWEGVPREQRHTWAGSDRYAPTTFDYRMTKGL